MFDTGVFVSRTPTEIAQDAYATVGEARRRVLNEVYGSIVTTEEGKPKEIGAELRDEQRRGRVNLDDVTLEVLRRMGVNVASGMSGEQFQLAMTQARAGLPTRPRLTQDNNFFSAILAAPGMVGVVEDYKLVAADMRELGLESEYEWTEEAKDFMRERFAQVVAVRPELAQDYIDSYSRAFGILDFDPPQPPPLAQVEASFTPPYPVAIDGDTFAMHVGGGERVRVRIVGLNAPEQGQEGYEEARQMLDDLLTSGRDLQVAVWEPDRYGVVQDTDPNGGWRMFAWLYVDGKPLYDPSVFESTNPSGARVGGEVVDLEGLLK
jgi:endonuclease YncB( thermonuclease family)